MIAAVPAVVLVADLFVGHPNIVPVSVVTWLGVYIVLTIVPLAWGARYPEMAGLSVIILIQAWSTYHLLFAGHAHAGINAFLELPMLALYIGWSYGRVTGTVIMSVIMLIDIAAVIFSPVQGSAHVSPAMSVTYAVLIAGFCFEGARSVRRQLHLQSIRDPLTGALNRRGLLEKSQVLRGLAKQGGDAVSLAVIDFDNFRELNNRGGHAAGDTALCDMVLEWKKLVGMRGSSARRGGIVARLGGDEFTLCFRAERADADRRLRALRARSSHEWSWGIVELRPETDLLLAIEGADELLYKSKREQDPNREQIGVSE